MVYKWIYCSKKVLEINEFFSFWISPLTFLSSDSVAGIQRKKNYFNPYRKALIQRIHSDSIYSI